MSYLPFRSLVARRLFFPEVGTRPPTTIFRQNQIRLINSSPTPPPPDTQSSPNTPQQPPSTTSTPILSPHTSPQISSTRLQKYAPRLTSLSHRTGVPFASLAGAFLVLHELTALVPLVILFFILESLGAGAGFVIWVQDQSSESEGSSGAVTGTGPRNKGWRGWVRGWIVEGEEKIGRVGRRYGILGYEKVDKTRSGSRREKDVQVGEAVVGGTTEKVANALAAYVLVKALLPFRIAASLALAPSFARFALYPIRRLMGRIKPKPRVK